MPKFCYLLYFFHVPSQNFLRDSGLTAIFCERRSRCSRFSEGMPYSLKLWDTLRPHSKESGCACSKFCFIWIESTNIINLFTVTIIATLSQGSVSATQVSYGSAYYFKTVAITLLYFVYFRPPKLNQHYVVCCCIWVFIEKQLKCIWTIIGMVHVPIKNAPNFFLPKLLVCPNIFWDCSKRNTNIIDNFDLTTHIFLTLKCISTRCWFC